MIWRLKLPPEFRAQLGDEPTSSVEPDALLDLTERQAGVLLVLSGAHRPLSPSEVGRRLGIDPKTASAKVTKAIKRLVDLQVVSLVERKNDRVVRYQAVYTTVPPFRIVSKGRKADGNVVPMRKKWFGRAKSN